MMEMRGVSTPVDIDAVASLAHDIWIQSQQRRGTGLGKAILAFVEKRCASMGIRELWLTVNRNNTGSISF